MIEPYCEIDQVATLYLGDALSVLAQIPEGSVGAVVADPPYSSGGMVRGDRAGSDPAIKYRTSGAPTMDSFGGDNRDQRGYAYWSALWLGEALRVTRPGGLLLVFTDWRQLPTTTDAIQAGGWVWRGIAPWVKPLGSSRPQSGRFMNQCEYVVWGSRGSMPVRQGLDPALPGFFHGSAPRLREHITQKPVDVLMEMLELAPTDAPVLDPFMGSGTAGVAAVQTGHTFIGIDQAEHWCQVAERRIRDALGQSITRGNQTSLALDGSS